MTFKGPSQQIGISLPAELVAYLKRRKEQEGVTISAQCRLALEGDIMNRAEDDAPAPDRTAAQIDEFLYGPQRRAAAGSELIDSAVEYETEAS